MITSLLHNLDDYHMIRSISHDVIPVAEPSAVKNCTEILLTLVPVFRTRSVTLAAPSPTV